MKYCWNNFSSHFFNVDISMGQGSALSSILSALYISPVFHILENCLKNLKIPISILSFVNDGLFIAQSKSFTVSNSHLFYSYNIVSSILDKFGLVLEHGKMEVFYFSRAQETFNSSSLDLSMISGPILKPKDTWGYLGFIFDRKLSFHQHINFYANKAVSTVKCMKILGNSIWGLISQQKQLLYKSCILPITLYGFQLWFYKKALLSYLLGLLNHIQQRAATWILGIFCTSPSFSVKAIAGLISINLYLYKLSGWAQLRVHSLPHNHILCFLLESRPTNNSLHHSLSLDLLTCCQRENIKDIIVDMDNRFNGVFPSFDPLNSEFSPGLHLFDIFSSHFSFHSVIKHKDNNLEDHSYKLNNIAITSLLNHSHTLIISDAGIKNNVTTSIAYIHVHDRPIIKTIHHTTNVTSTKAELFAIRCGINQAVNLLGISKIIVITDSIHAVKKIFDLINHPYQLQLAAISEELEKFFIANINNSIKF